MNSNVLSKNGEGSIDSPAHKTKTDSATMLAPTSSLPRHESDANESFEWIDVLEPLSISAVNMKRKDFQAEISESNDNADLILTGPTSKTTSMRTAKNCSNDYLDKGELELYPKRAMRDIVLEGYVIISTNVIIWNESLSELWKTLQLITIGRDIAVTS